MDGNIGIIIARFGWVYIGFIERQGEVVKLTNARSIIEWGTTRGLEELAKGPTSRTKLSDPSTVKVPWFGVVAEVDVDQTAWTKVLKAAK